MDTEPVGRARELETIEAFLREPLPRALVLVGEAGIGKTTLWRSACDLSERSGLRVLRTAPTEREAELSWTALRDLLGESLDEVAAELPPPQRDVLEIVLLRRKEQAPVDPASIAVATRTALRALAAREPLVVAVDDVQWLDRASAGVLAHCFARLRDDRIALILAKREGVPAPSLDLERMPAERLLTIELGGLSLGSLHQLLRRRLAVEFRRPTLAKIHEASRGNPFFALELARAMQRGDGELVVSENMRELIDRRLRGLSPATREALELLAAGATRDTGDTAFRRELESALHEAADEGIVLRSDPLAFTHPLFATSVYAGTPSARRLELHRRLADLADDPEERARQLALATDDADASIASIVFDGATAARARGAPAAAAELAEHAARLVGDDIAASNEFMFFAADSWWAAGDIDHGFELLERVAERSSGDDWARARVKLASNPVDYREALEMCTEVCERDGLSAETLFDAHELAMKLCYATGDLARAETHYRAAATLADALGDPEREARTQAVWAIIAAGAGRGVDLDMLRRAASFEREHHGEAVHAGNEWLLGLAYITVDDLDEARAIFEGMAAQFGAQGRIDQQGDAFGQLAKVEIRAGRLDVAERHLAVCAELAEQLGDEVWASHLAFPRGLLAAARGAADAEDTVATVRSICEAAGDQTMLDRLAAAEAQLALASGDAARALAALEPLHERLREHGLRDPSSPPFAPELIEALVREGRTEEAERWSDELERRGRDLDRPFALAVAARSRGVLAAARGDVEAAAAAFEEALRHHERIPVPLELGRTLLQLGTVQRRARQRAAARETLERARAIFQDVGAHRWAAAAEAELARVSGRTAEGGLTRTERRVAELVAQGLSNKEVAAALFVSVKTVEAHLSRIYEKLGVRSRTALAKALGDAAKV